MKELFYTGVIFFTLGSLMLFLHRLFAEAVRFSEGIDVTLHFAGYLYIPSVFFIMIGLIFMLIYVNYLEKKAKTKPDSN